MRVVFSIEPTSPDASYEDDIARSVRFRVTEMTSGRARSAAAAEAGTAAEKPLTIASRSVIRRWSRRMARSTERSLPGAARTMTESQVEPAGRTESQVEPAGRTEFQVEPAGRDAQLDP